MRMADPHLNVHRILAQGRVRIQRARVCPVEGPQCLGLGVSQL